MDEPFKKENILNKTANEGLEILPKLSHNGYLSNDSMVEFVKLIARYAAERDHAYLFLHFDQGGNGHDSKS